MRPPTLLARHGHKLVSGALGLVLAAGGVTAAVVRTPPAAPAERAALSQEALSQEALSQEALAQAAPVQQAPEPAPVEVVPPAPSAAAPKVAPLKALRAADLVVTATRPLTRAQLQAIDAVRAVVAVTVLDAGTVNVGGKAARVVGVDPSQFRAFTPQETASSDALWQAVARGELAPSYALQRSRKLVLGAPLRLTGSAPLERRIGAVAAYGLPGVDVVTDRATARALGVVPSSAVLVSAPERSIEALLPAVQRIVGDSAEVEVLRVQVAKVSPARKGAKTYRDLYVDGARYCPGLSWTVLAAIGQVESGHGKNLGPSSAGALGPMQFLPSTWAAYGVDGDRDGKADIMSPYDAIPSAAGYLCRFGANRGPEGLYDAIFAYNHADWYVRKVLGVAKAYEGK